MLFSDVLTNVALVLYCNMIHVRIMLQDESDMCWQRFKTRFNDIVRDTIRFAKKIPGFSQLEMEDQLSLIKGGCFEVKSQFLVLLFLTSYHVMKNQY